MWKNRHPTRLLGIVIVNRKALCRRRGPAGGGRGSCPLGVSAHPHHALDVFTGFGACRLIVFVISSGVRAPIQRLCVR